MGKVDLNKKFRDDLDELARRFIAVYGLKYTRNTSNLASPVTRWLDFCLRYVSPRPRHIAYSSQFPKLLSQDIQDGFDVFVRKIIEGEDINPYQGRGLIERNDTSGSSYTKRTDLLWASWGILHFHLTKNPIPSRQYFSDRSSHQAFCIFDEDVFAFIDILPHPEAEGYSDPHFMQIIADNWPHVLERFELKGILPSIPYTAHEIHQLRNVGINSALTINGRSYAPIGMGLTTAGTSLNQQKFHMRINAAIGDLVKSIELNPEFESHVIKSGVTDPQYGLTVTDKGLRLYEAKSETVFNIDDTFAPTLRLLQGNLFPDWALKEYAKSSYANNF